MTELLQVGTVAAFARTFSTVDSSDRAISLVKRSYSLSSVSFSSKAAMGFAMLVSDAMTTCTEGGHFVVSGPSDDITASTASYRADASESAVCVRTPTNP
jgi:hypothetical protein